MKAAVILLTVLLVLVLIGQIRIGGQARYSAAGAEAWIRLGGFRFQVYPSVKKEKKPNEKKKEPRKESSEPPKALPEKIGGALDYAQALLPVLLDAVGHLYRKLRVDTLELELTAGSHDPADAAMLYGRANAALGALWYPLTKALHVKDGSARVRLDFDAADMTLYAQASLSLTLGQILWLVLYFGLRALKGFLAVRRQQKIESKKRKAV
jgi:hypothetical protein